MWFFDTDVHWFKWNSELMKISAADQVAMRNKLMHLSKHTVQSSGTSSASLCVMNTLVQLFIMQQETEGRLFHNINKHAVGLRLHLSPGEAEHAVTWANAWSIHVHAVWMLIRNDTAHWSPSTPLPVCKQQPQAEQQFNVSNIHRHVKQMFSSQTIPWSQEKKKTGHVVTEVFSFKSCQQAQLFRPMSQFYFCFSLYKKQEIKEKNRMLVFSNWLFLLYKSCWFVDFDYPKCLQQF